MKSGMSLSIELAQGTRPDHQQGSWQRAVGPGNARDRSPCANLDTGVSLWVVLDELNVDIPKASCTLQDRSPRGCFGPAFADAIMRGVQRVRAPGKLNLSERS